MAPIRIAVGTKARTGKDTVGDYLVEKYGFKKLSFAAPLYRAVGAVQTTLGLPVVKDPIILQLLGEAMRRSQGVNFWVEHLDAEVDDTSDIVITDMRRKSEYYYCLLGGWTTIRMHRPDRPIDRDPTDISEIDLDDSPVHYEIQNSGTYEELYAQIDEIVKTIRKK